MGLIYIHANARHELIKFREFQKSCPIDLDHVVMARLHDFGEHHHQSAWQLIRMVYGARRIGGDPLGRATESIQSACRIIGIARPKLEALLVEMMDAFYEKETGSKPTAGRAIVFPKSVRGRKPGQISVAAVKQEDGTIARTTVPMAVENTPPIDFTPEATLQTEDQVLDYFGFTRKIFDCTGRGETTEKQEEIAWFCARLKELKRLFDEPMTKELAHRAMVGEILLRRIDSAMMREDVSSETFAALQKTKLTLEEKYSDQWKQIDSIVPYASAAATKQNFAGVVSDLINAVQRFEANHDTQTVDGVLTKFEVEIMLRQAKQHGIRYRPSLPMYWKAVQENLWNADWQNTMPTHVLKLLDAGFKGAVEALTEKGGILLPDLTVDGPEGEYPKLGSGPIGMPKEDKPSDDPTDEALKWLRGDQMVPLD